MKSTSNTEMDKSNKLPIHGIPSASSTAITPRRSTNPWILWGLQEKKWTNWKESLQRYATNKSEQRQCPSLADTSESQRSSSIAINIINSISYEGIVNKRQLIDQTARMAASTKSNNIVAVKQILTKSNDCNNSLEKAAKQCQHYLQLKCTLVMVREIPERMDSRRKKKRETHIVLNKEKRTLMGVC